MLTVPRIQKPSTKAAALLRRLKARARTNGTLRFFESKPLIQKVRPRKVGTKAGVFERLGMHVETAEKEEEPKDE